METGTLNTRFWMAKTQFTNAQAADVLQWAYDNNAITTTSDTHNEVNATEVKYGNRRLVYFSGPQNRLNFVDGTFTVDTGWEEHPLVQVSWYGAVKFCNWLTIMRDGNNNNIVYSGITADWDQQETVEDTSKNGFRLPSSKEWEYAARYLGQVAPATGAPIDEQRLYGNDNQEWTNGYYWTPGNYASGATTFHDDTTGDPPAGKLANNAVAVYRRYWDGSRWVEKTGSSGSSIAPVAQLNPNMLGIYDMSGNVYEWCFTPGSFNNSRIGKGGSGDGNSRDLQIGDEISSNAQNGEYYLGFRICRTDD